MNANYIMTNKKRTKDSYNNNTVNYNGIDNYIINNTKINDERNKRNINQIK